VIEMPAIVRLVVVLVLVLLIPGLRLGYWLLDRLERRHPRVHRWRGPS
jgi:hypothetical protein